MRRKGTLWPPLCNILVERSVAAAGERQAMLTWSASFTTLDQLTGEDPVSVDTRIEVGGKLWNGKTWEWQSFTGTGWARLEKTKTNTGAQRAAPEKGQEETTEGGCFGVSLRFLFANLCRRSKKLIITALVL